MENEKQDRDSKHEKKDTQKTRYMKLRESTAKQYRLKNKLDASYSKQQERYSKALLQEEAGFIDVDDDEDLSTITQGEIKKCVDITSAAKSFDLSLDKFGPYRISYTRNGRHLLIGGRVGHLATFDWITKRLHCEINVMEEILDVSWLHQETMLAAAQKDWVYIYDNQGIELHCIKQLYRVLRLEFLPYHFLLVASSDTGYLSWLDVSIGKLVTRTLTSKGRLNVMCQNPNNAVILLGHSQGTVTMWSPSVKQPLVSMLCHSKPVSGMAVDVTGNYMATVSINDSLKIWDIRMFKSLHSYRLPGCASHLAFSQRGLLAVGLGNTVQIYQNPCQQSVSSPYLTHCVRRTVKDIAFCPFEDVLGIGHDGGFSSILVPGSGEPNFDALEVNPFQTKSQRREAEVKYLLDKIQPELIVLDPSNLNKVAAVKKAESTIFTKSTKLPRMKASLSSMRNFKRKTVAKETANRDSHKKVMEKKAEQMKSECKDLPSASVLDRFKARPKSNRR